MTMRAIPWLVLPLAGVAACTGGGGEGVEVGAATRATVTEVIEAPATVVAKASSVITAPASGQVATLQVHEGRPVQAGDVLLVIDSPDVEAQHDQAVAAYEAAQGGNVSIPRADFSSTQKATDAAAADAFAQARDAAGMVHDDTTREVMLAQVDQSEAAYAAVSTDARQAVRTFNAGLASLGQAIDSITAAQRAQAEAALLLAEQAAAALTIRAPISGTVTFTAEVSQVPDLGGLAGSLPADVANLLGGTGDGGQAAPIPARQVLEVGMPVSVGAPLLSIVDMSELSLMAEVDETDILLVSAGVAAEIELDAVPGARYRGTVENADFAPTSSARGGVSYLVRLSLGSGTGQGGGQAPVPLPGMSAVADLTVRTDRDAVAVPASAVLREGERDTVWVVVDGRAQRRMVTLGAQGEELVAIESGLAAGERIVTRGADLVDEGDEVP